MALRRSDESYAQRRLRIFREVDRAFTWQVTRILHTGVGDTFEYSPEELRARHRRARLGPALTWQEQRELAPRRRRA